MKQKYPALRSISAIYRVVSWLVVAAAVLLLLSVLSLGELRYMPGGALIAFLSIGMLTGLLWLTIRAVAELIVVFVDIEHNTRAATVLLTLPQAKRAAQLEMVTLDTKPVTEPPTRFCVSCGAPTPWDGSYCPACGTTQPAQ